MKRLYDEMTVDVGWNTATAYWSGTMRPVTRLLSLSKAKMKAMPVGERFDDLAGKFEAVVKAFSPKMVWIEGVTVYGSSEKSMAAATKGDLSNLAYLCGIYRQIARSCRAQVEIIPPSKWKGQLNDSALDKRIARATGMEYPSHVNCAVGMGLSLMGEL